MLVAFILLLLLRCGTERNQEVADTVMNLKMEWCFTKWKVYYFRSVLLAHGTSSLGAWCASYQDKTYLQGLKCSRKVFFDIWTLGDVLKHQVPIPQWLSITLQKNRDFNHITSKARNLIQYFILDTYFVSIVFNILLQYFTFCKIPPSCWMYWCTQIGRVFITSKNVSPEMWAISPLTFAFISC